MENEVVNEVRPRFVPRSCAFDPEVDLQEVEQFGFVNLSDAYENGIIPGGVDMTDEQFNGVQNPGTLISHAQDVFDGLRKAEYVKQQLSRLSAEEREKVEKQVEKTVEASGNVVTE